MFKECLGKKKRDVNFRCSFINGMYIKILDVWIRGKISMINLFIFLWYMNVYIYLCFYKFGFKYF